MRWMASIVTMKSFNPVGIQTAHPWHGVSPGAAAPQVVTAFVEIIPTDVMKYEVDKDSGLMRLDRPQRYSSQCPCLYGFIPQSYCGEEVALFCEQKLGRKGLKGDGDPIDILILSERPIQHAGILVEAEPIGGLRLIDGGEVDDKIIAVLKGDVTYTSTRTVEDLPPGVVNRIRHYFLTYKSIPEEEKKVVEIAGIYSRDEALEIIQASFRDYKKSFVRS